MISPLYESVRSFSIAVAYTIMAGFVTVQFLHCVIGACS